MHPRSRYLSADLRCHRDIVVRRYTNTIVRRARAGGSSYGRTRSSIFAVERRAVSRSPRVSAARCFSTASLAVSRGTWTPGIVPTRCKSFFTARRNPYGCWCPDNKLTLALCSHSSLTRLFRSELNWRECRTVFFAIPGDLHHPRKPGGGYGERKDGRDGRARREDR